MARIEYVHLRGFSELEIVFAEPLLENAGIPFYRIEPGLGRFMRLYMASAPSPIELYVPADRLEEARELISFPSGGLDQVPELAELPEDRLPRRRFSVSKIMAAAMIGFSAEEMPTNQYEVSSLGEKAVYYYKSGNEDDDRLSWTLKGMYYLLD
ncbi:DUF2007 domain-containing protein [Paenibacillus methanolicus]|uniref:Putative signal transducing protein n=1 Tax=Paenibacillus methanolicus TaxID=582686 RepID=A0A5S5BXX6_9BACL|nr:DUF2007 domain-containing protein [Paenibacillus methanolicus]TYP72011.1 putative signal transducing protein [Paenibacillus methanolicus]